MGFLGAIKLWCAKYDLDRCDSFGSIPRILKTVEDHKGTEGSSKIEDLALSKLLAMKMGGTPEDRLTYAQALAIFPQGPHRAIAQLTSLSNESSTLQLADLSDFVSSKLTHNIVMAISTRRDAAVPRALRHICARSAPRELEESYKYAFTSLCRWGTDEALDVAAEIFYKNAELLRQPICSFVEARLLQKPEGPVQVKRLLEAITDPEKLVPSLQGFRTEFSLGRVFRSIDNIVKGADIDLMQVFENALAEARAPSKTAEARARAFSQS
jgi:hypothetical protein